MQIIFKIYRIRFILCSLLLSLCITGCSKLVETDSPYTSTNAGNVYTTDATAVAVLTGIYTQISSTSSSGISISGISLYGGLSADEFSLNIATGFVFGTIACYKNAQTSLSASNTIDMWSGIYPYIFDVNVAIEGLNASNSLTPAVKQQLLGEAKFMRAFFYFYLTNLYGDVPLVLSTDYTKTATVPRAAKAQVYSQIIQDLKDAQGLLSSKYVDVSVIANSTERTRPNLWAATALLARVYLYMGDYSNAETQATMVINNSSLYSINTLASAFLKNNSEAAW